MVTRKKKSKKKKMMIRKTMTKVQFAKLRKNLKLTPTQKKALRRIGLGGGLATGTAGATALGGPVLGGIIGSAAGLVLLSELAKRR